MQRIARALTTRLMGNVAKPTITSPVKPLLEITDNSTRKIHEMLCSNPAVGVLLTIKRRGCSGNSFEMQFAESIGPNHEVVEKNGVNILFDKRDTLKIIGTKVDYQESDISSGFTFSNPNATGSCGCGESFSLDGPPEPGVNGCTRKS